MKVLHIITGLESGGAEAVLYRLCQHDNKNKHIVVSLKGSGKYGKLLNDIGVQVYFLAMSRNFLALKKLIYLILLIKRLNPDVVQTWLYHADFVGGLAAKVAGIQNIYWGIHNSTLSKSKTRFFTRIVVKILAFLSSSVPKRIIVCGEVSQSIHIQMGYDKSKMVVIHNGYDTAVFKPDLQLKRKVDGVLYDVPLLGMVARYSPQKDHENLFESLSILKSRRIEFKCLLVGSNMDEGNEELVSLIEKYDLSNYVILKGERNDLPTIMAALDLHILSSAYGEAFPNVLCEAMACGVPCVTTNLGDSSKIVGDKGWVVSPSNSNELANAIEIALKSLKKINSDDVRDRIVKNYGIEKMVASYIEKWNGN